MLLLWLVIDEVCSEFRAAYVALWDENSPTLGWVKHLAAHIPKITMQLLQSLAFLVKKRGLSPLTPLRIQGKKYSMTDIPSRSFGINPAWFFKTDSDLCNFFNKIFPLPNQASWTVFSPSSAVIMKVISILQMEHFEMGKWLQLKNSGKHVGKIGTTLSNLWEWIIGYRIPRTSKEFDASQASQLVHSQAILVEANRS